MSVENLKIWLDEDMQIAPKSIALDWCVIPFFWGVGIDVSKRIKNYFDLISYGESATQFIYTNKFHNFEEKGILISYPIWKLFWGSLLHFNIITDEFKTFIIFRNWDDEFSQLFLKRNVCDDVVNILIKTDVENYKNEVIDAEDGYDKEYLLSRYNRYIL